LLRLSNDVETNPGPTVYDIVNTTETVCADFSQGNQIIFGENAGKQCVMMSLTAIVYSQIHDVSTWNSALLNTILFHGNILYTFISNSINKDLLLLTDVPEFVSVNDTIYHVQYSESYTGHVFMISNNEPYLTLQNALNKIFLSSELNYSYALLTISCNTVAIFRMLDGSFRIFDSHARNLFGMQHAFGKCVLLAIANIQNLTVYFQSVSPRGVTPFEIKGVKVYVHDQERSVPNHNELIQQNEIQIHEVNAEKNRHKNKYRNETVEKNGC
jgi:hypothetical protein